MGPAMINMQRYAALIFCMLAISAARAQSGATPPEREIASIRPAGRYLKTKDIRIYYREWNREGKQPIILLHGLFDTSETWAAVGSSLATRGYRVIAPDRRGSGQTTKPSTGYDVATLGSDLLHLASALNLREVIVVGHSAGAAAAMSAAAAEPDMLRSIILVDGGFWPKQPASEGEAIAQPTCSTNRKRCERAAAIEKGSRDHDPDELYPKITIPTLLIVAIPDDVSNQISAADLTEAKTHAENVAKQKLKRGSVLFVHSSGHWIQKDRPEALVNAIVDFAVGVGRPQ